jgi:hypothetical protein
MSTIPDVSAIASEHAAGIGLNGPDAYRKTVASQSVKLRRDGADANFNDAAAPGFAAGSAPLCGRPCESLLARIVLGRRSCSQAESERGVTRSRSLSAAASCRRPLLKAARSSDR